MYKNEEISAICIEKHGEGSYWDHLPTLSRVAKLQNVTKSRFMSQHARYQFCKFSDQAVSWEDNDTTRKNAQPRNARLTEKNCIETKIKLHMFLKKPKVKFILSNLAHKSFEKQKNESVTEKELGKSAESEGLEYRKWVQEYERRVSKFRKDNCVTKVIGTSKFHCSESRGSSNMVKSMQLHKTSKECKETFYSPYSSRTLTFNKAQEWPVCADRSIYCFKCHGSCSSGIIKNDVIKCKFCSAVIHRKCLEKVLNSKQRNTPVESTTCFDCEQELKMSELAYKMKKKNAENEIRKENMASKLCATWRSRTEAKKYKKNKNTVLHFQAILRASKLKRRFYCKRRDRPRPMLINVIRGINLSEADWENNKADPYVILTVLNKKNQQIWRKDFEPVFGTICPFFNQQFLVPGCPGTSKIILSVFDRDEIRDQFLGQGYLSLSNKYCIDDGDKKGGEVWERGGLFRIKLDELRFMPKTTKGTDIQVDMGAVDFRCDNYRKKELKYGRSNIKMQYRGEIEIRVKLLNNKKYMCGYLIVAMPLKSEPKGGGNKIDRDNSLNLPTLKFRKFWCVIVDGSLFLYPKFGAPRVKEILTLKEYKAIYKNYEQLGSKEFSKKNIQIQTKQHSPHIQLVCTTCHKKDLQLYFIDGKDVNYWRVAFQLNLKKLAHSEIEEKNEGKTETNHQLQHSVIENKNLIMIDKKKIKRRQSKRRSILYAQKTNAK